MTTKILKFGDYLATEIECVSKNKFIYTCETDEGLGETRTKKNKEEIVKILKEDIKRMNEDLNNIREFLIEIELK